MEPYVWVIAIEIIALTVIGWFMICNRRTYSQRMWMMNDRKNSATPAIWSILVEMQNVSYDKHLWYLVTFRDPIKLYGPNTQKQWAEGHK